jgi:enoyl-CoA hydratase/carnithine racemase
MNTVTNQPVLFEERLCVDGSKIAIAQLNAPKTLNGLTLDMTRLLTNQMQSWLEDPAIALVILRGTGDKAFCAGGDLHSLYQSMKNNSSGDPANNNFVATFFAEEYALDFSIHTYPKPILVWGDGIVMGGGMGLMMGASHRVVTETTRLAMPEISIGLFPDVGGTWLLNRVPGNAGLFLGLTGAQLEASDALFAGMADYHVSRGKWEDLLSALTARSWQKFSESTKDPVISNRQSVALTANHDQLDMLLTSLHSAPNEGVKPLQENLSRIQQICNAIDLERVVLNILKLADHSDPWLQKAAKTLRQGSPGSARLTYDLLRHNKLLSLAEVFRVEWVAGVVAATHGDFAEGIRALLIDKDKQPKWSPPTLQEADEKWVQKFYSSTFLSGPHPLANLGK